MLDGAADGAADAGAAVAVQQTLRFRSKPSTDSGGAAGEATGGVGSGDVGSDEAALRDESADQAIPVVGGWALFCTVAFNPLLVATFIGIVVGCVG